MSFLSEVTTGLLLANDTCMRDLFSTNDIDALVFRIKCRQESVLSKKGLKKYSITINFILLLHSTNMQ